MDKRSNETAEPLQWLDYLVFGIVLLISASIGIYYRFSGGRQKTAEEYFSANRSMSIPLLSVTITVAFMSAIMMLGVSGELYIYGAQYIIGNAGYILATPIVAFFYLPVFFKLQNMSVYQYLERRFGTVARLTASIGNLIQMGLYTGVVLFAPALALEATTGLSSTLSILLIGLICTFYSSIGGIKAVLATDVFQGFLMVAAVFCVIIIGCYDIEGGIAEVLRIAKEGGRLDVFNFDIDPTVRHSWWTLIIGATSYYVLHFGVNQIHVQRLLSAKSLRSAQMALLINTPLIIFTILLTSVSGLVLYAWFKDCDPVASGKITAFDQVMPYFAKIRMSKIPGLMGFFIAGIFSASLSTVSAMLNSLSAIAIADYVKPIYRKFGREFPDSRAAFYGKILCFVNGLLCLGIAFMASGLGNLMQAALAINGAVGGPILGLFNLGLFVETANEMGSIIGIVLSLLLSGWMTFGRPKPPVPQLPISIEACSNFSEIDVMYYQRHLDSRNVDGSEYFYLYRISYMLYTPIGIATTMIFGYIASIVVLWLSKNSIPEPDPDLFTPILAARIRRRRQNFVKSTSDRVYETKVNKFVSDRVEVPVLPTVPVIANANPNEYFSWLKLFDNYG